MVMTDHTQNYTLQSACLHNTFVADQIRNEMADLLYRMEPIWIAQGPALHKLNLTGKHNTLYQQAT